MSARLVALTACLVAGCARPPAPNGRSTSASTPAAPSDTMVLEAGAYRIWLAEGRAATDSTGTRCYERSVEVRTDAGRTKVPLLYVLEAPTNLDGEHVRALLSYRCHPMAVYRVELATGRPTKIDNH